MRWWDQTSDEEYQDNSFEQKYTLILKTFFFDAFKISLQLFLVQFLDDKNVFSRRSNNFSKRRFV